jgi:hypothetical protein
MSGQPFVDGVAVHGSRAVVECHDDLAGRLDLDPLDLDLGGLGGAQRALEVGLAETGGAPGHASA